jgi:hypothetical protein
MIVFNLCCQQNHSFEGWFRSSGDFDDQQQRGLLSCPVCGSDSIVKKLSAPRLNVSASRESRGLTVKGGPVKDEPQRMVESKQRETHSGSSLHESANQAITQNGSKQDLANQIKGPSIEQMQALWYRMAREVIANTEDVGEKFVEEARKIHYRETPERAIRGKASREEVQELSEEGIDIYTMPIPESLKEPLQ